jgi:preprotein translocase subunit SecG
MTLVLQILLIVTSLALIALILLHRAKGGGLSSLFGGSMQSSLSGSSVVERNLDRLTLFIAVVWIVSIIGIGLFLKVGAA